MSHLRHKAGKRSLPREPDPPVSGLQPAASPDPVVQRLRLLAYTETTMVRVHPGSLSDVDASIISTNEPDMTEESELMEFDVQQPITLTPQQVQASAMAL